MILSIIMAIGLIPAMFTPVNHPCQLREFDSVERLEQWLENNYIDHAIMIKIGGEFDCDDYALRLIRDARKDGYDLHFQVDVEKGHAVNSAIVGNEVYFIEPQTDEITYIGRLD